MVDTAALPLDSETLSDLRMSFEDQPVNLFKTSLRLQHDSNPPAWLGLCLITPDGVWVYRKTVRGACQQSEERASAGPSQASELRHAAALGKQRPAGQRAQHQGPLVGAEVRGDSTLRTEQAVSVSRSCRRLRETEVWCARVSFSPQRTLRLPGHVPGTPCGLQGHIWGA